MKKFLIGIFSFSVLFFSGTKVFAGKFEDAINDKKPSAVLIYADWVDDIQKTLQDFSNIEREYANKYNFVRINIGREEAKEYNKSYYIYPNLPYVMLFKDRGRMSRCITLECLQNNSCAKEKLDFFAN